MSDVAKQNSLVKPPPPLQKDKQQSDRQVFISFKTAERKRALQLKNALNKAGYDVWWQEAIQCGQEWHGEIDKAIDSAGAIVVLWSARAIASPWVRHEASQAMANRKYAPVRTELIEIEAPYNRMQATDIIDWDGEPGNPGFQNLLVRLNELLPSKVPAWRRATHFLWQIRLVVVLAVILAYTLSLLLKQRSALNAQITKQEATFQSLTRQSQAMNTQIRNQDVLSSDVRSQTVLLNNQLRQQDTMLTASLGQSEILQSQIKQQQQIIAGINRLIQPIQNLSVDAYVSITPQVHGAKQYTDFLREQLLDFPSKTVKKDLPAGIYVSSGYKENPEAFTITNESELWPSKVVALNGYSLAFVIENLELLLQFRLEKSSKGEFLNNKSDLELDVGSNDPDGSERSEPHPPTISWNVLTNELSASFSDVPTTKYWRSSGKITSVPDMDEASLTLKFSGTMVPSLDDKSSQKEVQESRRGLKLSSVYIRYSGMTISFGGPDMNESTGTNGLRIYTASMKKGNRY